MAYVASFVRRSTLLPTIPALGAVAALTCAACGARSSLEVGSGGATATTGALTTVTTTTTHATTVVSSSSSVQQTTSQSSSSGTGGLMGPVISEGGNSFFEAETSIVIDPGSKRLAASWIAVQGGNMPSSMGYAFSTDLGANWTMPNAVVAPAGRDSSDPVLAVDAAGNFFLAFVGFRRDQAGMPFDMHIYVAESPAGSTMFLPPVEATDPNTTAIFYDKPWITVTKNGTIVVSYLFQRSNGTYSEAISRSPNGQTWTQGNITPVTGATAYNLSYFCYDTSTARLHAVMIATGGGTNFDVVMAHSDDNGQSWSLPVSIAGQSTTGEQIAADDPTCVAFGGKVYALYGVASGPLPVSNGAQSSISLNLVTLTQNGSVKAGVQKIQDPSAGTVFQHATIAADQAGNAAVVYYAASSDDDMGGSYRVAHLGNVANLAPQPSQAYFTPIYYTIIRASETWLGDYTGLTVDKGTAYTSFVTNEPGPSHIAFTKLP